MANQITIALGTFNRLKDIEVEAAEMEQEIEALEKQIEDLKMELALEKVVTEILRG